MQILVTGASGFVGSALVAHLRAAGHAVATLARSRSPTGSAWNPDSGELSPTLTAPEAVVHLAGASVAQRWTPAVREAIASSRGPLTDRLCRSLAALPKPPRVLVSASAIGVYGDRGDEVLDERSAPGRGFLVDVGTAWEAGTAPLAAVGTRVVHLRIGLVLDRQGGALGKMLLPFRLGLGGPLGSGRQWTSWITRHDLLRAIAFALTNDTLRGPVNAVAPAPVTNRDFTRELGRALRRPAVLPVPAFALRLLFGAMANDVLLASTRVQPTALLGAGFTFAHADLGSALRSALA